MKQTVSLSALFLSCLLVFSASGQGQSQGTAFTITKISRDLITIPQYTYAGALQIQANQREVFLQVETEFSATGEPADDVTFKYYVAINGKVLTGEVTHTNIFPGKGMRSVMYVPPKVLERFNAGRAVTINAVQNIAVQILQGGTLKDEATLTRAAAKWYSTLPQVPGLLLNKNETPFAPLYWDRYEQIKAPAH
jgi:hypothetical protein